MGNVKKVAIFWPGDYRPDPNTLALPEMEQATAQMTQALKKLGREPYLIEGFLSRPHEAIEKLGPIDDPMVGVFVHWTYGPHVVDGVSGKDNPLLLASNFSGTWPGLVALLNTSACLKIVDREHSRIWTDSKNWTEDTTFMERLEQWCTTGRIEYCNAEVHSSAPIKPESIKIAHEIAAEIRKRRVLAMSLGDTSMGMINGYFGARILHQLGFSEHKVDQAWLIDRGKRVSHERIESALKFCIDKGVKFHWQENTFGEDAFDFTVESTKEQLRMYLTVLDLVKEFQIDCMGWQYQLGLLPLLPPSDFCEGLLNSTCRPEGDGDTIVCSTEADQGNMLPMEMMKRILKRKGLNQTVNFHDVRWGGKVNGRFLWLLLNSGSCSAYSFNHKADSLEGVHSYRQAKGYFPVAGGTFTGESLPGEVTWARAWLKGNEPWMDVGYGECIQPDPATRDHFWQSTSPHWPFMMIDAGCSMESMMAHYNSNHMAVCYGNVFGEMLALSQELGFKTRIFSKDPSKL